MKLQLPDVTLVCIDSVMQGCARIAIQECMKHADFGEVLYFSDRQTDIPVTHPCYIHRIEDYERYLWKVVPPFLKTSHFLIVQWDSWIIDPDMWSDEFLQYDYIGAPWFKYEQRRDGITGLTHIDFDKPAIGGNGGFSLRSRRLAWHLCDIAKPHDIREDVFICRTMLPQLQSQGFKIAPYDVSIRFSFECYRDAVDQRHFGFHAFRNWPFVINEREMARRFSAANLQYLLRDDQFWWLASHATMMRNQYGGCGYKGRSSVSETPGRVFIEEPPELS